MLSRGSVSPALPGTSASWGNTGGHGTSWQPDHVQSPGQSLRDCEQVFLSFSLQLYSEHSGRWSPSKEGLEAARDKCKYSGTWFSSKTSLSEASDGQREQ